MALAGGDLVLDVGIGEGSLPALSICDENSDKKDTRTISLVRRGVVRNQYALLLLSPAQLMSAQQGQYTPPKQTPYGGFWPD